MSGLVGLKGQTPSIMKWPRNSALQVLRQSGIRQTTIRAEIRARRGYLHNYDTQIKYIPSYGVFPPLFPIEGPRKPVSQDAKLEIASPKYCGAEEKKKRTADCET
ncbi:hypothetical protein J3458_014609 [Metarhizium acridum]|uniref:uncharacterized protein n=1 Tax=Metarhizium acridum TaxID=92637 RepID=UPI001C6AEAC8|nr:hypothetical protein J3458_014609 [Metarhizium acridum]